jgi:hypothetical protein
VSEPDGLPPSPGVIGVPCTRRGAIMGAYGRREPGDGMGSVLRKGCHGVEGMRLWPKRTTTIGPLAPVCWTWGQEQESALARLQNNFRVGDQGQMFRDFVEVGRRLGRGDPGGVACEPAVFRADQRGQEAPAYRGTSQRGVR